MNVYETRNWWAQPVKNSNLPSHMHFVNQFWELRNPVQPSDAWSYEAVHELGVGSQQSTYLGWMPIEYEI